MYIRKFIITYNSEKEKSYLQSCFWQKEKQLSEIRQLFSVSALPIFPGRRQPSIFGANELNFRVRDGNGWTLIAINTDYAIATALNRRLLRFVERKMYITTTQTKMQVFFSKKLKNFKNIFFNLVLSL